ncbi:helix-turn-helix transcriptional regulator [Saccharopolyspora shandongensis]|uniref:helix-turn-helix domain-containing protein n=1 Tax=Saccharopolyspora shandongensis TaxID=418495 RepID=UPI00343BA02B
MSETPAVQDWAIYMDTQLAERGWEVRDLAAAADLSPSVVFRWKHGFPPNLKNARAAAGALGVPLLEIMVVSGLMTPAEAGATVSVPPGLSDIPDDELVDEMRRRLKSRNDNA